MEKKLQIYKPRLFKTDANNINLCLETGWISSRGSFVEEFEKNFSTYMGGGYAATCSNGTTALTLAIVAIGLKSGDTVVVPSFTYIACINVLIHHGINIKFIRSSENTLQLDLEHLKEIDLDGVRAILVPHLYGSSADMDEILSICRPRNILVIEDCAEAIGTKLRNRFVGTYGDISTFSFFGNKTITTGEGGMVFSKSREVIENVKKYRSHCQTDVGSYQHFDAGYNFRMTNICAAVGCSQLENINININDKRNNHLLYKKYLNIPESLFDVHGHIYSTYWMEVLSVGDILLYNALVDALKFHGIEYRPVFSPAHEMEYVKKKFKIDSEQLNMPWTALKLNLPSYPDLTDENIQYIANVVNKVLC